MNDDHTFGMWVPDIEWQQDPPPERHPIPVAHVHDLAKHTPVTVAIPGRFVLDNQILLTTEPSTQDVLADHTGANAITPALMVTSAHDYHLATGTTKHTPSSTYWPLEHIWVYTDALNPGQTNAANVRAPTNWLELVRPDTPTPPVRRPIPAREALPLTGRTVRMQATPGTWIWWVAVSEPFHHDDEIRVRALPEQAYWLAHVRPDLAIDHTHALPIHRLFVYA